MNFILKYFYKIWFGLVVVLHIAAIISTYLSTQSFSETLSIVQYYYSPFNIGAFMLNMFLLSPAFGAYLWREHRLKKLSEEKT